MSSLSIPLQNVLRTWYARDPEIVATEDGLVETAHRCMQAFINGELSTYINRPL